MGSHAPRLPELVYRGGYPCSITCCTWHRRPWFRDPAITEHARTTLHQLSTAYSCDVLAYCFMPDHVHLLVEPTSGCVDVRRLVNGWKQMTGFEHRRTAKGRLWQSGYYDHVLRNSEDMFAVIRYLVGNPLRARLVQDVRDYPFWGSTRWSREALLDAIGDLDCRGA